MRVHGSCATGSASTRPPTPIVVGRRHRRPCRRHRARRRRVLEATSLEMDESTLTGESLLVRKRRAGAGGRRASPTARACSTRAPWSPPAGPAPWWSPPARRPRPRAARWPAARARPPGVVQARLRRLTSATLPVALGAGAAVVGVDLLRGRPMRTALGTGVSLAVAAVPEGLPLRGHRRPARRGPAAARSAARWCATRHHRGAGPGRRALLRQDRHPHRGARQPAAGLRRRRRDAPVDGLRRARTAGARRGAARQPGARAGRAAAAPDRRRGRRGRRAGRRSTADDGARRVAAGRRRAVRVGPRLPRHPRRDRATGSCSRSRARPRSVLPRCTTWTRAGRSRRLDAAARAALADKVDALARQGYRVLAVAERPASGAHGPRRGRGSTGLSFLGPAGARRPGARRRPPRRSPGCAGPASTSS